MMTNALVEYQDQLGVEGPSVRKRTLRKASEGHFGGSGA